MTQEPRFDQESEGPKVGDVKRSHGPQGEGEEDLLKLRTNDTGFNGEEVR